MMGACLPGLVSSDGPRRVGLSVLMADRVYHLKVRGLAWPPVAHWSRLDGPTGKITRHVPGRGIRVVRGFVQVGQGEARRELAADLPGE